MNSLTDVGQIQKSSSVTLFQLDFRASKFNAGLYGALYYKKLVGARLEFTYGSVSGNDSKGTAKRQLRNLSYRSSIKELAVLGEMDLLNFAFGPSYHRVSPYPVIGIAWFSFNPRAMYKGELVELQPLSTEGQGFKEFPKRTPYKLSALNVPFGFGVKYDLTPKLTSRFEILARYTFTDYLDDASDSFVDPALYSQYFSGEKATTAQVLAHRYKQLDPNADLTGISRGGKLTRDMFMTINFKFGYVLGTK